ncbi:hypothetical protein OS189_01210 [Sulfitobacter sp. F26169L]|uniref:hypothetical protein n=1 Tax=Sulfitobacter sp. F26169L TaxID=2996015 RepID=UPI002260A563|nr:hypothetical protein [Sulfitobacter sp. F26169L]MCX7564959.1 hypothetical protein [Sulfitobacter sp. F26169L]
MDFAAQQLIRYRNIVFIVQIKSAQIKVGEANQVDRVINVWGLGMSPTLGEFINHTPSPDKPVIKAVTGCGHNFAVVNHR